MWISVTYSQQSAKSQALSRNNKPISKQTLNSLYLLLSEEIQIYTICRKVTPNKSRKLCKRLCKRLCFRCTARAVITSALLAAIPSIASAKPCLRASAMRAVTPSCANCVALAAASICSILHFVWSTLKY